MAGRAVAGDWESAAQTVRDAGESLPALIGILLVAIAVELYARLTSERPRALRGVADAGVPAQAARLIRFDFHFTTDGWRISEANADVPGGV